MIFTGYYSKQKEYQKRNLFLVSISRWDPKYAEVDMRLPALAPTSKMLKDGYSWEEYEDKILSKLEPHLVAKYLKNKAGDKTPVILCWEKDDSHCHRSVVSKWFNKNGIQSEEYVWQKTLF